jgi:REP element-mobilizing transposase RayT
VAPGFWPTAKPWDKIALGKNCAPRRGAGRAPIAHTYTKLFTHVLFSTKNRDKLIPADIMPDLHAYIGGIVKDVGGKALIVGGVEDHVHMLALFPPRIALSDAMREVKAGSSRWMKEELKTRGSFAWQTGFHCIQCQSIARR